MFMQVSEQLNAWGTPQVALRRTAKHDGIQNHETVFVATRLTVTYALVDF